MAVGLSDFLCFSDLALFFDWFLLLAGRSVVDHVL
jgi:hypothetical protein